MSSTYEPQPLDTSQVVLDADQAALVEALTRNAHEVWASQRIEDGWTYGPARDDAKQQHPCIVPYDELPEAEKNYDRILVLQVIKSAIAMGYQIGLRKKM